jgi:hypothetical protein
MINAIIPIGGIETDGVVKLYGQTWYVECTIEAYAVLALGVLMICKAGGRIKAPGGVFLPEFHLNIRDCVTDDTPIYTTDQVGFCDAYNAVIDGHPEYAYDASSYACVF